MKLKLFVIVLLAFCGSLSAKTNFRPMLADTAKVLSKQDSVAVYDSTLIFAVQRKLGGYYKTKKMYFYQLKNILNTTLSLSNLSIPRLNGTATTNIALKTFASDSIYRADFNYNFRKIDSLTVLFDSDDFTITGDTVRIKRSIVPDSSASSGYSEIANKANSLIGAYGVTYTIDDIVTKEGTPSYAYLTKVSGDFTFTGTQTKTIIGLTNSGSNGTTVGDSSITVQTGARYLINFSVYIGDTVSTSQDNYDIGIYKNNTVITTLQITPQHEHSSTYAMAVVNGIIQLAQNDIIKIKVRAVGLNNMVSYKYLNFSMVKEN
jgi:hypothetical protein